SAERVNERSFHMVTLLLVFLDEAEETNLTENADAESFLVPFHGQQPRFGTHPCYYLSTNYNRKMNPGLGPIGGYESKFCEIGHKNDVASLATDI
ncbi:MAG: hypothetical protein KF784_15940, partial [Fimbriimonadaceae bacterium]|nr:hypothetical protein [Fimbriimonadaceae bacterium]